MEVNAFDTNISVSYYLVKLKLIFEFLSAQISLSKGFLYKIHMTEHDVTMIKQILLPFPHTSLYYYSRFGRFSQNKDLRADYMANFSPG